MRAKASSAPLVRMTPFNLALPERLKALINAGIVDADPRVRRRHRFANVASYALGADALLHLVVNSLHDFGGLALVNIYNTVAGIAFLLMHRLHRFGERVMANALVALAVAGHSFVVFAFGLDSNLHVYFTMAGGILFFVGVEHWRNFLALYALSVAALFAVMTMASPAGFVLPGDVELRRSLSLQAFVSAAVLNAVVIGFALSALYRTEKRLEREFERAEGLLASILPSAIAARLRSGGERRIADRVEGASVLFADLVGFTTASAGSGPEETVDYLHRLFRRFDTLCERYGVDKIKTIGDCYMAVGGLHGDVSGGAAGVGRLALAMREAAAQERLDGRALPMRFGIHTGPVVAGVIGDIRIAYDVWGDTVNVAARLESSSRPGAIHVSAAWGEAAGTGFLLEQCGETELRGAGRYRTAFLLGEA